jgi:hypothetical protein
MALVLSAVSAPSRGSHLRYLLAITGREYQDILTIAPGVTAQQSIGVARRSEGIYPYDGILG